MRTILEKQDWNHVIRLLYENGLCYHELMHQLILTAESFMDIMNLMRMLFPRVLL